MMDEITCCPESLYDVGKEEGNLIQILDQNIEWIGLIMFWDKIKKKKKKKCFARKRAILQSQT